MTVGVSRRGCYEIRDEITILAKIIDNIFENVLRIKDTSNISAWLSSIDMMFREIDALLDVYRNSKNKKILGYIVASAISVVFAIKAYIEKKVSGQSPTKLFENSIKYFVEAYESDEYLQTCLGVYRFIYPFLEAYENLCDVLELLRYGSISLNEYADRIKRSRFNCPQRVIVNAHNFFDTLLRRVVAETSNVYRGLWQKIIRKLRQLYAETIALTFLYDFILSSRRLKDAHIGELRIINANPCFSVWIKRKILRPLTVITVPFNVVKKKNAVFFPKLELSIEFTYGRETHVKKSLLFPEVSIYRTASASVLTIAISRYNKELSFFAQLQDDTLSKILQFRAKLEKFEPEIVHGYVRDIVGILMKRKVIYEELLETTNNIATYIWPHNIQRLVGFYFKAKPSGQVILIFPLDDAFLHIIPWELVPLDNIPISLRIPIMRQASWEIPYGYDFKRVVHYPEEKINMLLLGNLTADLPQAERELNDIESLALSERYNGLFDSIYRISYTNIVFKSATKFENIRKIMDSILRKKVSVIHIATHMDIDEDGVYIPILAEGHINKYYMFDLFRQIGISNTLLFINSCIARGETLSKDAMYQLLMVLSKFPDAVSALIFPMNKIFDSTAKMFSMMFYEEFLKGAELGACLRNARNRMLMLYRNGKISDLNWLSYVAYGNPYLSLRQIQI